MKPRTAREDPRFPKLNTDRLPLKRAMLLIDRDEPKFTKFITDTDAPSRAKLRRDTDDPIVTVDRIDN